MKKYTYVFHFTNVTEGTIENVDEPINWLDINPDSLFRLEFSDKSVIVNMRNVTSIEEIVKEDSVKMYEGMESCSGRGRTGDKVYVVRLHADDLSFYVESFALFDDIDEAGLKEYIRQGTVFPTEEKAQAYCVRLNSAIAHVCRKERELNTESCDRT